MVLVTRSGGFTAEAERLASSRGKTANSRSGGDLAASCIAPTVPWGQAYLDLAVEKGFLTPDRPDDFEFAGPATRLEVAKLLAHALYLVPPVLGAGSAGAGFAETKAFTDEALLPPDDRAVVRAVAAAGVMSGYPEGDFRPLQPLTRAEMAVVLSRLVDRGWVKTASGQRLMGWISGIKSQKERQELEFTTLAGVQKIQASKDIYCFRNGEEWPLGQAVNFRCELIMDGKRQAGWIDLLEQKDGTARLEKIRGSVKSVALGEDNLLVLNDLNCEDHVLPLAWDAVVAGKKTGQGFKSLKPGEFVDVELSRGQVRKVSVLEVKTVSSTVDRFHGVRLYLKDGLSANKPGWFNYYDRARVVDKEGKRRESVPVGARVQVTYLDPFPGEIDDEIALEIKVRAGSD